MTREQAKRAAQLARDVYDCKVNVPVAERPDGSGNRHLEGVRRWYHSPEVPYCGYPWQMYASMLLSEAHRPDFEVLEPKP
jgi:hypothetical protein